MHQRVLNSLHCREVMLWREFPPDRGPELSVSVSRCLLGGNFRPQRSTGAVFVHNKEAAMLTENTRFGERVRMKISSLQ